MPTSKPMVLRLRHKKKALHSHQHDHSWHDLDKPKQNFNMQKGTPKLPNMAAKVAPKRRVHQCSYLGIKGHTLKAWKRSQMQAYKHDLWTEIWS